MRVNTEEVITEEDTRSALESLDRLEQEFNDIQSELLEEKKVIRKNVDFLKTVRDENYKEKFSTMKKNFEEIGDVRSVKRMERIIFQLDNIESLGCLKNLSILRTLKGKNKKEIQDFFSVLSKRVFSKLERNKKYTFYNPLSIESKLKEKLPEGRKSYARKFMILFFHFIDIKPMEGNALFVSTTINRIAKLGLSQEDYDYNFVQQIVDLLEKDYKIINKSKD